MALPAMERRLAFHPANFNFILSRIKLNSCEEVLGCLMGMLKYFPKDRVDQNPRTSHKDSLVSMSTLREKYNLDLASLTVCPGFSQNSSNTSQMALQLV